MGPVPTALSSNDKTKSLCSPWKVGLTEQSKYCFFLSIAIFDWYLLQLIVLIVVLIPDFNCGYLW